MKAISSRSSLLALVAVVAVASGCGSGGANTSGSGNGGGGGASAQDPIALQFAASYNFYAYVDSAGALTNVQDARVAVFGGAPPAAGYSFTLVRGAGVPNTITLDPSTGVLSGTPGDSFVPGSPGQLDPPGTYIYDLTIKVSDGSSTVSSAAGDMRIFIANCNSSGGAWTCGSSSAPYPEGSPQLSALGDGTQQSPIDIAYEMSTTQLKVNRPFAYLLPLQGGSPPYTFALTDGSLPPGLALDTTSGLVHGTPTSAAVGNTYTFAVTVTDGASNSSTAYYTLDSFSS